MPEFMLKQPHTAAHPFYSLNAFARGYVEAMFFTNGDTGDERENLLNEWGVERLTKESVAAIASRCARFETEAAELLREAYARDYSEEQAGRDFWFTSQGHGAGFWDRDALEPRAEWEALGSPRVDEPGWQEWAEIRQESLGNRLSEIARQFGELYVDAYRGWIHVR